MKSIHPDYLASAEFPLREFTHHIKKMKKSPNDRILDKSGEFFWLKPFVSIMHIVFDFRRVQLLGS